MVPRPRWQPALSFSATAAAAGLRAAPNADRNESSNLNADRNTADSNEDRYQTRFAP
jgi:hypothetical protein